MATALTYAVELAVGLGCLLGMAVAPRRPPWPRLVLAVAGAVAVAHALVRLIVR
jgi:hypothetical protein